MSWFDRTNGLNQSNGKLARNCFIMIYALHILIIRRIHLDTWAIQLQLEVYTWYFGWFEVRSYYNHKLTAPEFILNSVLVHTQVRLLCLYLSKWITQRGKMNLILKKRYKLCKNIYRLLWHACKKDSKYK